jgi:predicted transcriptional regulator
MKEEHKSAFLEYFGDTPKLRFLDFLIGNHFFDFNMTDMARESNISYNSLKSFFDEFLEKGIIVKTRRVGKSDMYKLNMENAIAQNFLKFAWFLTEQDLGVENQEVVPVVQESVSSN